MKNDKQSYITPFIVIIVMSRKRMLEKNRASRRHFVGRDSQGGGKDEYGKRVQQFSKRSRREASVFEEGDAHLSKYRGEFKILTDIRELSPPAYNAMLPIIER